MSRIILTLCFLVVLIKSYAQPVNNLCGSAISLSSLSSCTTTAGTLAASTYTTVAGACGASTGNRNDVWYSFTAQAIQASITVSGAITTPRFQVYTNNCGSPTSIFCSSSGSGAFSGLTPGTTYLVRVYCNSNSNTTFNICITHPGPTRMREVFADTIIATNGANLNSPWEITYGSDGYLWITESKNFLVRRLDPKQRYTSTIVLDLTSVSWAAGIRKNYTVGTVVNGTATPDPQGGLMGLALHPEFNTNPSKRFVYVSYVRQYLGLNQTYAGETVNGHLFMNNLVRFTYNTGTGVLESPIVLCDTLRGSNDHNSGRMIISSVGGTDYLFYSEGDMGAGQFANVSRTIKSQLTQSYEGKILRFNLEPDGDADQGSVDYDQWIPNDNPFNNIAPVSGQSAVYSLGHRNIQGLALIGNTLYGSSHGPFSDDEVNVLEAGKNYGHPNVIGYSTDGNYNNAKAGPSGGSLPLITTESAEATALTNYKDPIFTFYPAPAGNTSTAWSIQYIYNNISSSQSQNQFWGSIAPSGMDAYTSNLIPGWKNSLLLASLKKGFIARIKPNGTNTGVESIAGSDTAVIFNSQNRFRDLTFSPDGKDIFVVIDRSGSTSGPTSDNPVSSACAGCILKYTFLGYAPSGSSPYPSTIPAEIPIDSTTNSSCVTATAININTSNNNLWVPITGPNGNIIAEIDANGNNLGDITTSFYTRTGAPVRSTAASKKYLNRNVTINVQNQPASSVAVRLYITAKELADMIATSGSGVTGISDVGVFKNNDPCGTAIAATATGQTVAGRYTQSTYGHAIQFNVTSFSSFYFFNNSTTLPFDLITFTAKAVNENAKLQWVVSNEQNIISYSVERSTDGVNFEEAGTVTAAGNQQQQTYHFTDFNAARLASVVYYRIRSNEFTGTGRYTNTLSVNFIITTVASVSVKPNPVVNKTNLLIDAVADELVQIKLIDNTGRIIKVMNVMIVKGKNTVVLDLSSLQTGLYYVDVNGQFINEQTKLIKQ
jgi:trimeric autotransporter adhesin